MFKGSKIDLYYVPVYIYQGGTTGLFTTLRGGYESFVRRKNDKVSYNMGYIYGAGQRGIKKRVKDYFTDCPLLIEKVMNDEIPKKETNKIVLFYELNCQ